MLVGVRYGPVKSCITPVRTFFNFPGAGGSSAGQTYQVKKRVNFTPKLMYKIVADVSRYQEFVPFVEESFINSKDEATSSPTEAGLRVGWKQFDEKFTCKLICTEDESVIAESITHLLFDKLHTQWTFKELKNPHIKTPSCEVQLDLVYSFKNPLYNTVTSMFSEQVAKVLMKAFEKRARDLKMKELKHR